MARKVVLSARRVVVWRNRPPWLLVSTLSQSWHPLHFHKFKPLLPVAISTLESMAHQKLVTSVQQTRATVDINVAQFRKLMLGVTTPTATSSASVNLAPVTMSSSTRILTVHGA